MQDQDQRSKITVNYLDRTKDRDHWQRSWRSRSKIDDLPHLWQEVPVVGWVFDVRRAGSVCVSKGQDMQRFLLTLLAYLDFDLLP